jgi:hypothetical protein
MTLGQVIGSNATFRFLQPDRNVIVHPSCNPQMMNVSITTLFLHSNDKSDMANPKLRQPAPHHQSKQKIRTRWPD